MLRSSTIAPAPIPGLGSSSTPYASDTQGEGAPGGGVHVGPLHHAQYTGVSVLQPKQPGRHEQITLEPGGMGVERGQAKRAAAERRLASGIGCVCACLCV